MTQEELMEHFEAEWRTASEKEDLAFKKADHQALLDQGKGLLQAFYTEPEPVGHTLVAVEEPFRITLTPELPPLVGKIDAVYQRNNDQESALIIDFKTSATSLSEFRAAEDHQLTAYAMALEADGYPIEKQTQGFLALIKTKTPKTQTLLTQRTQRQKEQFVKVVKQINQAIEAGVFIPRKDFTCSDCQFQGACAQW
jgi:CRISPR/Cas system-associated exonuclease Cas4 (RecB family)